jgi:hypothetical protein
MTVGACLTALACAPTDGAEAQNDGNGETLSVLAPAPLS